MKTIKNLTAEEIRKSILQLAIQGKLVKQDPSDEPASELVKRIYAEKQKLIREGKIKKDKNESFIFKGDDNCYYEKVGKEIKNINDEIPFEIPENWTFFKLESLTAPVGNKKNQILAKEILQEGKYPVITQGQNLIEGYTNYENKLIAVNSDEPVLMFGDHTRNIKIIDFPFVIGADGTKFFKPILINAKYLFFVLSFISSNLKNRGYERHYSLLKNELIPLPPLSEQCRIVNKIENFNNLLKQYAILEQKLSLLESSFEEKLKASILQYAIEGKLVKQNPEDEPASVLLERIKSEKEKLIKEGKIKRDKNESFIYQSDDKNYYEKNIPVGWILAKIGQLGTLTRGFGIKRTDIIETGYPCIRYGELYTTYKFSFSYAVSYTSLEIWEKSFKVKENDILMTLTGENKKDISMALAYLGKDYIAYGGDMTCLSNHHMNPLYLVYAINSPYGRTCMQQLSTGDIIVHMSNDRLSKIILPIPPLNEQMKIVTKINQIFCLID